MKEAICDRMVLFVLEYFPMFIILLLEVKLNLKIATNSRVIPKTRITFFMFFCEYSKISFSS